MKRRKQSFEVGELVLVHLRKERLPKGEYNKLKFKKIGPCKIINKFSNNASEIEFPAGMGISPIFNEAYLYKFHTIETKGATQDNGNDKGKQQVQ